MTTRTRRSSRMVMPRYTRMVGRLGRIASVLLIVLLAGGPALAAVCEAVCVVPSASTEPAGTDGTTHDHHRHATAETPSHVQHTAPRHDHHESGADAAASSRDSQLSRMVGRDCCRELAPPRASLTASRGDMDLLPGSHAAVASSAAMLDMRDRQPAGPTHGPPPGVLLSTRTPLVLRI